MVLVRDDQLLLRPESHTILRIYRSNQFYKLVTAKLNRILRDIADAYPQIHGIAHRICSSIEGIANVSHNDFCICCI